MTNHEATKALDLLNALTEGVARQNEIDITDAAAPLRSLLQRAALRESGDKTGAKLLSLVTEYLKHSARENKKSRPALCGIQHDKYERQFILDGYSTYVFNGHRAELDTLPQTAREDSIDVLQILDGIAPYECDKEDDIITAAVWENIGKYKAYLKSINAESEYNEVYIFGRVFDSDRVATAAKFCGSIYGLELYSNNGPHSPVKLVSEDLEGLILPVGNRDATAAAESRKAVKKRTLEFLEIIKNKEDKNG